MDTSTILLCMVFGLLGVISIQLKEIIKLLSNKK